MLLLISIITISSCHKNDETNFEVNPESIVDSRIIEITNSIQFNNNNLLKGKKINYLKSKIEFTEINNTIPVINIYLEKDNKTVGFVKAIKVPLKAKIEKRVPNNDEYVMIYFDIKNLNTNTQSSFIAYDLNYDNYKVLDIEYDNNNKIIKKDLYKMPEKIKNKYKTENDNYFSKAPPEGELPASCTGGDDKNVSWGECMDCLLTVCTQDKECSDVLFINTPVTFNSVAAMGTACVVISLTH